MRLVVGTRGSKLSIIQTDRVIQKVRRLYPDLEIDRRVILTAGDKEVKKPLFSFKVKGIFEKEIDRALLGGEVDFAVHSFKDVPSEGHRDIVIAAVPKRDHPNDVLVSKHSFTLMELRRGSLVGTSSVRRMVQLKQLRPDLDVRPIRGNVETRISKVHDGGLFGAIVIAEAGVRRLGLEWIISERLSTDDFTPAAGQGALAVVARRNDNRARRLLVRIDDRSTRAQVVAESQLTRRLEGGCRAPIGVLGTSRGRRLTLRGCIYSVDGRKSIVASTTGDIENPIAVGNRVADELLALGGRSVLKEWRSYHAKAW